MSMLRESANALPTEDVSELYNYNILLSKNSE